MTPYRTDTNNNPTAFTTSVAEEAGLRLGVDYSQGTPFGGGLYYTAHIIGDPIAITIRVISSIGFYMVTGSQRWQYIGIPRMTWMTLSTAAQRDIIGFMYQREGGTAMRNLFPNYGKL